MNITKSKKNLMLILAICFCLIGGYGCRPDLTCSITCPAESYPGEELDGNISVIVENNGNRAANDFSVDLVLSTDTTIPVDLATYSPNFTEDVLLQGGREHVDSLAAGASLNLTLNGNNKIPEDTPLGDYYLGVVVDPGKTVLESNEANNTAVCSIKILAHISRIHQEQLGSPYAELDIQGIGFGSFQPNKIVRLGTYTLGLCGVDPPPWNNTYICGVVSPAAPGPVSCPVPYGKVYEVYLMDGTEVISNRFNFLLRMWPEAVVPEQGPPGTQIRVEGLCMGATQGTKILKLGPHTIPNILQWSSSLIRAVIPSVPAGTYELYIEEGGTTISITESFTVQ
jgi:hypothetical protein